MPPPIRALWSHETSMPWPREWDVVVAPAAQVAASTGRNGRGKEEGEKE